MHPVHGLIHHPGAETHHILAKKYDLGDIDAHPRGWFMLNKKDKKTYIKPYEYTGRPDTNKISTVLRKKLKVPAHFSHLDQSAQLKKRTYSGD